MKHRKGKSRKLNIHVEQLGEPSITQRIIDLYGKPMSLLEFYTVVDYPIQDDIWPSRRWNLDHTDYIDLSGNYE